MSRAIEGPGYDILVRGGRDVFPVALVAVQSADQPPSPFQDTDLEVSVVMPCLDEAETLAACIIKASHCLKANGISGEIIVADNGSSDDSVRIAEENGARVVCIPNKGYGNALMGGIEAARGKFVIMGDADDSYDFSNLIPFIEKLRQGHELVLGNRFLGGIADGAMPPLHRYFGNPFLTLAGRVLFRCPTSDIYCGLRGFTRKAYQEMQLVSTGMEFAVEMVIKGTLMGLRCEEVPTTLSQDGRSRAPHLRSWRDGWRTLRFMLLYSPKLVFLYPGLLLMTLGLLASLFLVVDSVTISGIGFDVQTLLYATAAISIGYQGVITYLFAKKFTRVTGLDKSIMPHTNRPKTREYEMEYLVLFGAFLSLLGLLGSVLAVARWGILARFGALDLEHSLRLVIPSVGLMLVGGQTLVASFFLALLALKRK